MRLSSRSFSVLFLLFLETRTGVALSSVEVPPFRIGARPSRLAQIQAQAVLQELSRNHGVEARIVKIQADGDHVNPAKAGIQTVPLAARSVDFTGALDDALLSHEIDIAVHSLKDIPPTARWNPQLTIAGHLKRQDPRDVLVGPYPSIQSLPQRAKVGTSSARRQAQLRAMRPDLELQNVRGNVETRLRSLKQQPTQNKYDDDDDQSVDALILAQSGLNRLLKNDSSIDWINEPSSKESEGSWHRPVSTDEMLSGACQGIVAVVCRANDAATMEWIQPINDVDSAIAAAAERAFLDTLDSFSPWVGRPPLASLMERERREKEHSWVFQGLLARPDGTKVIRRVERCTITESTSEEVARGVGQSVAEQILEEAGPDFYK
ncbi:Porphobilinogen deaminase [Seminavis robusta]|uniref:hydroxymethylbilane synthase n=1 Tax=Seminavis robusta TaxID=568900 RepID=A0A9N8HGX2_9STRA|nr:Porphobilinogen deaminase [Seminavis robusta]|eukprot:Sro666_g183960.1 Porphobilinogen deaminase (378) ;mRNA; f:20861-21994